MAGWERIVSTPPRLTDTSGKVRDSTKVCAFDSSLSLKPMTAPPVEACLKCVGLFPG